MSIKLKSLVIAISSTLFLAGCVSSMTTKSDKVTSEITVNNEVSYIIFSRPEHYGAALTNTIVEFLPGTKETKLAGVLGAGTKFIYETSPGEHYFYMSGGENDDMIKISTLAGKVYYIHTKVAMGIAAGRFYFVPYRSSASMLINSLTGAACNQELFDEYKLERIADLLDPDSSDTYASIAYNISISCDSRNVIEAKPMGLPLSSLDGAQLILKNEKAETHFIDILPGYQSEIDEDYPGWSKDNYGDNMMDYGDGFPLGEI